MGFFKDFKEDLSQAVNEIVTEPEILAQDAEEIVNDEVADVMVNTLDAQNVTEVNTIEEEAMNAFTNSMNYSESEETNLTTEETNVVSDETTEYSIHTDGTQELDSEETAIITKCLKVCGDLDSNGSIDLFGTVEGNVTCKGKLSVSGSIVGNSKASEVFANNAKINGDVEAFGTVKIGQGSVIVGNVVATSAVIAGAVKGDIDVKGPVIIDSSAVIVGDIKSKSVQINNGAAIEGRCSQCYADINPTTFFENK